MNARIQSATIHPFEAGAARSEVPAVRRPCRDKLFVQLILCGSRPELVGRTWSCHAVATEAHALEFLCDQPLPTDAMVDLWVDFSARRGRFFLSGFIHSAAHTDNGRYRIRVLLDNDATTDIGDWIVHRT